jgi:acetolactate synthase regulatory subunit
MSSLAFAVADAQQPAARFSVQARPEPGVMPRVLELFAKRGLVPRRWLSTMGDAAEPAALTIDIEIVGLERGTVDYVAACIRQIIGVETVLTA